MWPMVEAMANTLQNTKYSIDEKVEHSFIQHFWGTIVTNLGT
jgi:hypothetical protein